MTNWDHETGVCSNVYCHGEFKWNGSGNLDNDPVWTTVDGTQAACGTCHGLPPAPPHFNGDQCSMCHGSVVDENRNIINKEKHMNGEYNIGASR